MDIETTLSELRGVVDRSKSRPRSGTVVVDRDRLLRLVDEVAAAVDRVMTDSGTVLAERDAVVDRGRVQAEQIVADAHREREKLTSDTDVFRVARREARRVVEQARIEADLLRAETDSYVDTKLANFEVSLLRVTEAVHRGRERLAGRSDYAGITSGDTDRLELPEHLDP